MHTSAILMSQAEESERAANKLFECLGLTQHSQLKNRLNNDLQLTSESNRTSVSRERTYHISYYCYPTFCFFIGTINQFFHSTLYNSEQSQAKIHFGTNTINE